MAHNDEPDASEESTQKMSREEVLERARENEKHSRPTEKLDSPFAVGEETDAEDKGTNTVPMPVVEDATSQYDVPDDLIDKTKGDTSTAETKERPQKFKTLDVKLEAIDADDPPPHPVEEVETEQFQRSVQFVVRVSRDGRIVIPDRLMQQGVVTPGERVRVTIEAEDD